MKPLDNEDIEILKDKEFFEENNRLIRENRKARLQQVQQGKTPWEYHMPVMGPMVEATDQVSQGKYGKAAVSVGLAAGEVVLPGLVGRGVKLVGPVVRKGVGMMVGKGVEKVIERVGQQGVGKIGRQGVKGSKGLKKNIQAFKHDFKYSDRIRMRALEDPVSHNFHYSFDDAILKAKPILKNNEYKIFQLKGTMDRKNGVFEIGLTKDGIIDHRFFRPIK